MQCAARTIAYPTYLHENGHGMCNMGCKPDNCGGPWDFDAFMMQLKGCALMWDEKRLKQHEEG